MDVYSFGKVLLEMVSGQRPEQGPCHDQIKAVQHDKVRALIIECTYEDPSKRPKMKEVLRRLNQL